MISRLIYTSVYEVIRPLEHSLCLPCLILFLILTFKVDFQGIFITMKFSHGPDLFLHINEAKIANVTENAVVGSSFIGFVVAMLLTGYKKILV